MNGKVQGLELADTRPLRDATLIERTRREALRRGVDKLSDQYRVPLALFVEDSSYRQIAKMAHLNERTVKSRI